VGIFRTNRRDYLEEDRGDRIALILKQSALDRFTPEVLGLGDLAMPSVGTEAVCAIFDLGGFTTFSRQVDPHLVVPDYLQRFLDWLFQALKEEVIAENVSGGAVVYTLLPFFAKFMGDGVLLLWDTAKITDNVGAFNIPISMARVCMSYSRDFLPEVRRRVVEPPPVLRCGVARGRVYSVGNGSDFVGPCINIAARLQKLAPGLGFCFSRRGFDAERDGNLASREQLVLKEVSIRGIGDRELVYIRKKEFGSLGADEQSLFRDP
jgi:class 3 adenylate cyclase